MWSSTRAISPLRWPLTSFPSTRSWWCWYSWPAIGSGIGSHYVVWFHLLLGAAYAFHVTLTWHILKHSQTDISDQGYLFSAVIIFLGNVAVLLVGIPLLVSKVGVLTALGWWLQSTGELLHALGKGMVNPECQIFTRLFALLRSLWREFELKVVPGAFREQGRGLESGFKSPGGLA